MTKKDNKLTIKEVLAASRPVSWINTAAPFLVGYLLAVQSLKMAGVIGFIYFLFPYNLLLYGVNDIFDYESDIKNPRKNSIEGGLLEKSKHRALWLVIGIFNVPFAIYFMLGTTNTTRALFFVTIFFCFSYSAKPFRFKEVPFLDSINSALHFVLPFVFGLVYGQSSSYFWLVIAAFMSWGMASQAFGAIQDIKPDRSANIKSIATVLGAKRTNYYVIGLYMITVIITAIAYLPFGLIAALFLSLYVLNASFFLKYKSDARSNQYHRGWQNFMWLNIIVGFVLAQLLLFVFDPFGVSKYFVVLLGFFLLIFFLIQLGVTIYNLRAFARPKTKRLNDWPKISIIMHAYNQADNISSTILSLLGQQYPQFEVLFTDLGSQDNTLSIVKGFQDPRLKIVDTKPLKPGWTLNAWVSQQLLEQSTGDIVLLLSADTILLPNALSVVAGLITEEELSLVSLLPADQNKSLAQQIILSQNHYFMLGLFPSAYLAQTHPKSVNASSNIMAFARPSIASLGGFELVRKSPLEDFDLAAAAKAKGLKTGFYLGADIATSQNHASLRLIIAQNLRRFYPALHFSMPLTVSLVSGGIFVLVFPGILLCWLLITNSYLGILFLALAIGLSYINRLIITIVSRQSILSTLLYPLGSLVAFALLAYSMINYELLKPRWQNRKEVF